MRRSLALSLLFATTLIAQSSNQPAYHQTATVPAKVNGYSLDTFAYDPAGHRLYASSRDGLFWLNTGEAKPVWNGPTFKDALLQVRFAPELRRVFFSTLEAVGYADVDALDKPHMFAKIHAGSIVYEPTKRELYVSYRAPSVTVFNAATGQVNGTIEVPGWFADLREAIPGQVFATLPDKEGLYVINAASHHIGAWPVEGKIEKPVRFEVDPSGQYIVLSYYQNIVAIEAATAKVVGRLVALDSPSIAFDPGTNLLVTLGTVQTADPRVLAYRIDQHGFTLDSSMTNPPGGEFFVEPFSRGFIQRRGNDILLWQAGGSR